MQVFLLLHIYTRAFHICISENINSYLSEGLSQFCLDLNFHNKFLFENFFNILDYKSITLNEDAKDM